MSEEDKTIMVLVGYPNGSGAGIITSAMNPIRVEEGHLTILDAKGYPIAAFSPGYWTAAVIKDCATNEVKGED